jgi:GNAT superfamily N-acetyltransferase
VIAIRELTDADLARADAALPLSRLDTAQTYFIAWDDDAPVGHAHLAWRGTHLGVPEVQDVFVVPARRRQGIATLLTRACEEAARERGHERISLSVSSEQNPGARRLYEILGYRDADVAPVRVKATIMLRGARFAVDDTLLYLEKAL